MTKPARTSEREIQRTISELLDALGYAWNHTYPLRTEHGWRTGTTAKGIPDLVALRGEWIIAIEVKSETGRPKPEQIEWLERFAALGHGCAWIVDPSLNFQTLARWLQHPALAPARHGF